MYIQSAIPFEFPDFTQDPNFSCERHYGPQRDLKDIISQKITRYSVKSQDGTELQEFEVVMATTRGEHQWKIIQKWRENDPWWYEARRYEDAQPQDYEAILLRADKR